jgi:mannosylglycerate hydrolase MGH1-like protein
MARADTQQLIEQAKEVLRTNDMGGWSRPDPDLYVHQWLWDSLFAAVGLRHYDIERAKAEVRSPFRAQWKNGMLPHIIFGDAKGYHAGPKLWHCERSPMAPDGFETSGITQPPVAAEAAVRVGQKLKSSERKAWYREMYPKILAYHQWFYRERNPRGDGLPVIVLSWETGLDNSPPWMYIMHKFALGLRTQMIQQANLTALMERFRKDTEAVGVPAEERISTIDLYGVYDLIKTLRRYKYDGAKIMKNHKLQVVDVTFSCILIRANELLKEMADEIGEELPPDIKHAMHVAPHALATLWDSETQQYYNRNVKTGRLVKIPTIATFMPLYSGTLPKERVKALVRQLHDPKTYGTAFPIPTTPLNSPYFRPNRYWQGPTWVNMNWLVADGLERNGEPKEAAMLRQRTIGMVARGGMYEYFSPLSAEPAGADSFTWTAALTIDMLLSNQTVASRPSQTRELKRKASSAFPKVPITKN